jgi:hypothetical protein
VSQTSRSNVRTQDLGNRRLWIGGPLTGFYGQVAWRALGRTVIRLTQSHTDMTRMNQNTATVTTLNTANDVRNGVKLRYLLATGQIERAADGGASGGGPIAGGNVNWENVDSFMGWGSYENTRFHRYTMTADSVWSPAFSTQIAAGYVDGRTMNYSQGTATFVAPNVAANPTGTWGSSVADTNLGGPVREKAFRFSGVLTGDLFHGRARSQTAFGADHITLRRVSVHHIPVRADDNFSPIINPSPTAANNGYTRVPRQYWSVANGPVKYGAWDREAQNVVINGLNYTYRQGNEPNPALVSPENPLGLTGRGGGATNHFKTVAKGAYVANFINWLDGRLTTLAGARMGEVLDTRLNSIGGGSRAQIASTKATSFNAGANFATWDWLRPYIAVSDSHSPPANLNPDPIGENATNSRGLGTEVGFKFFNREKTLSGSLALFRANSESEQYVINGALAEDINPTGLNGTHIARGNWISVDRTSRGVQLAVTASPNDAWRLRLSASHFNSTIWTDKSYAQLYNDQFHANASGQVTYQNGTVVYVNPAPANPVTAENAVATSTTPNAAPLTIAMMNDPASRYFANPDPFSAQINASSVAATVLRHVDPAHGAILTGVTGLPISQLQIAPRPDAPPPGVIVVSRSGDLSTGNPRFSFNFTSMYTVRSGPLKGVRLGGTVAKSWKVTGYYYYENGISPVAERTMFYMSRPFRFDGILGYQRKLGRYGLSTQVNINNVFNAYDVIILPSATGGFGSARGVGLNATLNAEPRTYVWSATISF